MKVFQSISFELVTSFGVFQQFIQSLLSCVQALANMVANLLIAFQNGGDKDVNSDSDSCLESHEDISASLNGRQALLLREPY